MDGIYYTPKATENSMKFACELLLSDSTIELSDTPRQNKGTKRDKIPSKACNQTKTIQRAKVRVLEMV